MLMISLDLAEKKSADMDFLYFKQARHKLLKLKEKFESFSLRKKLLCLVGVLSFLIFVSGIIAFQGVQRVYRLSYPIAKTGYPLASSVMNALHSLEFSRALAIQYALEQDSFRISFLKKQFDDAFQSSKEELEKVSEIPALSKELKSHWGDIKKSQEKFEAVSILLMTAHEDQLKLSLSRYDEIKEAHRIVQEIIQKLNSISGKYAKNNTLQFTNIALQVMLLEQRYLYQPALSTPLSLTPEKSKEEETRIIQSKEKFRSYMVQFSKSFEVFKQLFQPKDQKELQAVTVLYTRFCEKVEGEDGVFLISEDEVSKLGTVSFQLDELQKTYEDGALVGRKVQKILSSQMQTASSAILGLKRSSYLTILGFTLLFMMCGIVLGTLISKSILFLEKNIQERTEALTQANLKLLQANELKSQFLSNMSHDLRTPLNSILGFTQIVLSDKGNLSLQQTKNLNNVLKHGQELLQMINLILEFSKMQAAQLKISVEEFSFETLLDECLEAAEVLIHGKKITLLKEVQTHLPHLQTDRAKIKRILLNLLSNAAKFTEKGSIKVSVRQKEEWLCFSVTDTGKGISQEHLFTVFQEFNNTSTHPESSGLGLAICKNFVTILGGTIDLESVPGNGTILTVKIPFIYQSKEEKLKEAA